jgi:hypothetical protein
MNNEGICALKNKSTKNHDSVALTFEVKHHGCLMLDHE